MRDNGATLLFILLLLGVTVQPFTLLCFPGRVALTTTTKLWTWNDGHNGNGETNVSKVSADKETSRRKILMATTSALATAAAWYIPQSTAAATESSFGASWSAVDGLNQMNVEDRDKKVVGFDINAYKAMRDDKSRTPFFEKAIRQRLEKANTNPENLVMLDLGTGPFCLFAMIAADLGVGKVYAIEANPAAAASARAVVARAGYEDFVQVVEGFSCEVQLPEKVDFCVAEIIGSVASEEGVYATIRDAHRFLKDPTSNENWIPCRVQTYGAPASYTLHNIFGPPEFDWTKLNGEPVRFSCRDNGLQLLSDPKLLEDLSFAALTSESKLEEGSVEFTISDDRITQNKSPLFDEFRQRSDKNFSEKFAEETSRSFTGIAMWPRIYLNDDLIVDSRTYPSGDHQKSHWQTVLPIMSARPIGPLHGGESVKVSYKFELPADVTKPPQYFMQGSITSAG